MSRYHITRSLGVLLAYVGLCATSACVSSPDAPEFELVDEAAEPSMTALSTDWESPLGWCSSSAATLYVGDFNGDGRSDMLCHDTGTGYKWIAHATSAGTFTGTTWGAAMGWCYHAGAALHIGDFNGDGRSDMLCHDKGTGYKWIAHATSAGAFIGTTWQAAMGWCSLPGTALYIGDFNGDRRSDMLCHDTGAGYKWIAHATAAGTFTGTTWQAAMGWCSHPGEALYIGDFNGDARSDMLCHDTVTGYNQIAYAAYAGTFGSTLEAGIDWCSHAGAALYIGDFNGDRRSDMLCHDSGTGYKWVALATAAGTFSGASWGAPMKFCYHTGARLFVDDYNGDVRDDLLCHDVNTGYKWLSRGDL